MEIRTTPIVVGPPHITPTTIDFDTMRERGRIRQIAREYRGMNKLQLISSE